jgi:hypothetical protein
VPKLPFTTSPAYFDPSFSCTAHTAAFASFRGGKARLSLSTPAVTRSLTPPKGADRLPRPDQRRIRRALGNRLVHIARNARTEDSRPDQPRVVGHPHAARRRDRSGVS